MNRIAFTIDGPPVYKDRPRLSTFGDVATIHSTSRNVKDEQRIADIAGKAFGPRDPWTGPVRLTVTAVFAIPKSWPKRYHDALANGATIYHDVAPDGDNCLKLIEDACNRVLWRDDSQVVIAAVMKRYGHPERMEVVAELITDAMGALPMPTPSQVREDKIPWAVKVRAREDAKARRKEANAARKSAGKQKFAGFRAKGKKP